MGLSECLAVIYIAKTVHDRDALARETRRNAMQLGQGVEDTSRLTAAGYDPGTLSKFQKSLSDQTPEGMAAFDKLKLDPDKLAAKPIKDALLEISDAFNKNVKNAADRSSVAMHLFGKGGYEVISTLSTMREKMEMIGGQEVIKPDDVERVKAWDKALKGASNTLAELSLAAGSALGGKSGIGTNFARAIEGVGAFVKGGWEGYQKGGVMGIGDASLEGFDKVDRRWRKEDYNTEHADEIAKGRDAQAKLANEGERYAKAMEKAAEKVQSIKDRLADLGEDSEGAARNRFMRDAKKDGIKDSPLPAGLSRHDREAALGQDLSSTMRQYDATIAEKKRREEEKKQREEDKKDKASAESMIDKDPLAKYNEESAKADRFHQKKLP